MTSYFSFSCAGVMRGMGLSGSLSNVGPPLAGVPSHDDNMRPKARQSSRRTLNPKRDLFPTFGTRHADKRRPYISEKSRARDSFRKLHPLGAEFGAAHRGLDELHAFNAVGNRW